MKFLIASATSLFCLLQTSFGGQTLGRNAEQIIASTDGNLIGFQSEDQSMPSGSSRTFAIPFNSGSHVFHYWAVDLGDVQEVPGFSDFRSITYQAPPVSQTTDVRLHALVGDSDGHAIGKTIIITVSPSSPIVEEITNISLSSGALWSKNSLQSVQWESNGLAEFTVWLLKDGEPLLELGQSQNGQSSVAFTLDRELSLGSDYQIRVQSNSSAAIYQDSPLIQITETSSSDLQGVDLRINSVSLSSQTSEPGQSVQVTTDVLNRGSLDNNQGFKVHYYLTENGELNGAYELGSHLFPAISAGGNHSRNITLTIPHSASLGSNQIVAVIDLENNVSEFEEANNSGLRSITLQAAQIAAIFSPDQGNTFLREDILPIRWSGQHSGSVRIELHKSLSLLQTLTSSTPNDGEFDWVIPTSFTLPANRDDYSIKIISTGGVGTTVESEDFTIDLQRELLVSTPTDGATHPIGQSRTIGWSSDYEDSVTIELLKNGAFVAIIATDVAKDLANPGQTYDWFPGTQLMAGSGYQVRVRLAGSELASALSGTFSLSAFNNFPPNARDDIAVTEMNSSIQIAVLGNDNDAEDDPLHLSGFTEPLYGTVTLNSADNTLTYQPEANFSGDDSFTYSVSDPYGTSTATIDIHVTTLEENTPYQVQRLSGAETIIITDQTIDELGNSYIVGTYRGQITLGKGANAETLTSSSNTTDSFLAKYDASHELVWTKNLTGTLTDTVTSVSVSNSGDIYCSGNFEGIIILSGGWNTQVLYSVGENDGFIAKFEQNGQLSWAKSIGGTGNDRVQSISANDGRVFVGGKFSGSSYFAGESKVSVGSEDIYLLSLDNSGQFIWVKSGSNGTSATAEEYINGIAVDDNNVCHVIIKAAQGFSFEGNDAGIQTHEHGAVFVKLDSGGNNLITKPVLTSSPEGFNGAITGLIHGKTTKVAIDDSGSIYFATKVTSDVIGHFSQSSQLVNYSTDSILACKADSDGNLIWVQPIQGNAPQIFSISLTKNNEFIAVGQSNDFLRVGRGEAPEISIDYQGDNYVSWWLKISPSGAPINCHLQNELTEVKYVDETNAGILVISGDYANSTSIGYGSDRLPLISLGNRDAFHITLPDNPSHSTNLTVSLLANDESYSTIATAPITIPVLENDYHTEGKHMLLNILESPAGGTAFVSDLDRISFQADPNFTGITEIRYEISSGSETAEAVTTIKVSPIPNTAPNFGDLITTLGTQNTFISSIDSDITGNKYIGGSYFGNCNLDSQQTLTSSGNRDGFFSKFDTNNQLQWTIRFSGGNGYERVAHSRTNANGDSFLIVDCYNSTSVTAQFTNSSQNFNNVLALIIKVDSSGEAVWVTPITGSGNSKRFEGKEISLTPDGGVVVLSNVYNDIYIGSLPLLEKRVSDNNGNLVISGSSIDIGTVKINSIGQPLWAKRVESFDPNTSYNAQYNVADYSKSLAVSSSGQILISGQIGQQFTLDDQSVTVPAGGFILSYDSMGNQLWLLPEYGEAITYHSTGNIFIYGGSGLKSLDLSGNIVSTSNWNHSVSKLSVSSSGTLMGSFSANTLVSEDIGAVPSQIQPTSSNDIFLFEADNNTNFGFEKLNNFGGPGDAQIRDLSIDINDNLMVAVIYNNGGLSLSDTNSVANSGGFDAFASSVSLPLFNLTVGGELLVSDRAQNRFQIILNGSPSQEAVLEFTDDGVTWERVVTLENFNGFAARILDDPLWKDRRYRALIGGNVVSTVTRSLQDRDGDSMADWWEDAHGLDKDDPTDNLADPDWDGFNNKIEFITGTNPKDQDSHFEFELFEMQQPTSNRRLMVLS